MTTHRLHTVGLEASQKLAAADWLQMVYGGSFLFDGVTSTAIGGQTRLSGGAFPGSSLLPFALAHAHPDGSL